MAQNIDPHDARYQTFDPHVVFAAKYWILECSALILADEASDIVSDGLTAVPQNV
jgi:hypothetical protein